MKHLFSTAGRVALRRMIRPDTLLAFDYDGTLASIVGRPASAHMRAGTRRRLEAVAARYRCLVITGRAVNDVRRFLSGVRPLRIIGSHGLEDGAAVAEEWVARVAAWHRQLAPQLEVIDGVITENKRLSLAVHYRNSRDMPAARAGIMAAASALKAARVIGGKAVVNLVPQEAPHKGDALQKTLRQSRCRRAIYVGDDDTDEDVFRMRNDRVLTVRIGTQENSSAEYFLRDQSEMDEYLSMLLSSTRE